MTLEERIKMRKFKDEIQKAHVNLYFTVFGMHQKESCFLKQFDLTPQQFNILRILRGQGDNALSIKDIKERMLDKNPDVGRLVKRLVIKGMAERKQSEADLRSVEVLISCKGREVLKTIDEIPRAKWGTGIANLNEKEAIALNNLLDKIREAK